MKSQHTDYSAGLSFLKWKDHYFSTGGGGPILISHHTIFLAIQQFQTIFFLFLLMPTIFLNKNFVNFCTKDSYALIKDHPLVF